MRAIRIWVDDLHDGGLIRVTGDTGATPPVLSRMDSVATDPQHERTAVSIASPMAPACPKNCVSGCLLLADDVACGRSLMSTTSHHDCCGDVWVCLGFGVGEGRFCPGRSPSIRRFLDGQWLAYVS